MAARRAPRPNGGFRRDRLSWLLNSWFLSQIDSCSHTTSQCAVRSCRLQIVTNRDVHNGAVLRDAPVESGRSGRMDRTESTCVHAALAAHSLRLACLRPQSQCACNDERLRGLRRTATRQQGSASNAQAPWSVRTFDGRGCGKSLLAEKVGGRQSRARASPVRRCEFLSRPRSCSAVVTLYLASGRRRLPNPSRMHLVPLQRDRADAASSSPGFFTMSEAQAPLSRRPGCGLCWSRCSRIR
jgi:hypothetical protein